MKDTHNNIARKEVIDCEEVDEERTGANLLDHPIRASDFLSDLRKINATKTEEVYA